MKSTPELLLTPQESLCLARLGFSLGKYGPEEQRSAISRLRQQLEGYWEEARRQRDQNARLCTVMGLASGVFAVIVLL